MFVERRYGCSTCRKLYFHEDEARRCEGDHIVDKAVTSFRARLAELRATPGDHNTEQGEG